MATLELKYLNGTTKEIRLFRCREDGELITDKKIREGVCAGHVIREDVELSLLEKAKLMLGVLS